MATLTARVDRPDAWEVMLLASGYPGYPSDRETQLDVLVQHFGKLIPHEAISQAFDYADRFSREIAQRLSANATIERMLTMQHP